MRPLPDLSPLPAQPSVYDPSTEGFVSNFASDFQSGDSLATAAGTDQAAVYAGVDPISQAIDAVGAALDLSGSVLDLLSGDLDLVNLDPEILNFQSADSALDAGLDGFAPDLADGAIAILNAMFGIGNLIEQNVINLFAPQINYLLNEVQYIYFQMEGLGLNGPAGILG